MYGNTGKSISIKKNSSKNILDIWILARLDETVKTQTEMLENYNVGGAAKTVEKFVSDLSHWYIRRSRKRFSHSETREDFESAFLTLSFALKEASKLVAPFCPFLAEAIYLSLAKISGGIYLESVHLENWPKIKSRKTEERLLLDMEEIRNLANKALSLRASANIKVRQPLKRLTVNPDFVKFLSKSASQKSLTDILKDEINVQEIALKPGLKNEIELDTEITPELYKEGFLREFVRLIQKTRQDGGLGVDDFIYLSISVAPDIRVILEEKINTLKAQVKAKRIDFTDASQISKEKFAIKFDTSLEGKDAVIAIKKV